MPRGRRGVARRIVKERLRRFIAALMQQFVRPARDLMQRAELVSSRSSPSSTQSKEGPHTISDDRLNRREPDRSKINMEEDYEVQYWMRQLGTTREELQRVVDLVGNSAAAVKKELGKTK